MTASNTRRREEDPWHVPTVLEPVGPGTENPSQPLAGVPVALRLASDDGLLPDNRRGTGGTRDDITSHTTSDNGEHTSEITSEIASNPSRLRDFPGRHAARHAVDFDDFVSTQPSDCLDDLPADYLNDLPPGYLDNPSGEAHPRADGFVPGSSRSATTPSTPARRRSVADQPLAAITGLLAKPVAQTVRFTGTGTEYFRIWVVNTLLTLLTLGLYSPWAKRRKQRWFARHTFLDGEPFDFHGDPRRILVGRLVALTLLVGYTHAFQWSLWAGWAMLGVLYLFGPALFAGAQRFRLGNTSWRGVRFGFQARAGVVYASCLPLVVAWTVTSVGLAAGVASWVVGAAAFAVVLGFPVAHGWLKRFQHQHAAYGQLPFSFDLSVRGFYGLYLAIIGLVALVSIGSGLTTLVLLRALSSTGVDPKSVSALISVASGAVTLVLAWPTYVARLQRLVWRNTRLAGGIEFQYDIDTAALVKVLATHGLLVLLTLGLYWPFLAVRLARLRIEALTVLADQPLVDVIVQARLAHQHGVVGDAAADAFGLDLGW
ncbi:Uncharacterized membrane protein YjgN, DUF898 family [Roseateles sp. YR242]|uniref:YjgN family protein n=1 Tax=Roseateles sp. YR242 TaxID=1855305 RepID=UPI0008C78811|nr:YjgN family protein [Roseateles sp. YR242]SEK68433.1 Uncharacterized membrane protein YjgN, DUF898 family [Roseateles sp. YR242]